MLGASSLSRVANHRLSAWVFAVLVIGVALAAFTWNSDQVFFGGNTYFADGDCYARMTRVRLLQDHPLTPIQRHEFENYPVGTQPHTTSPLDYLIAGLAIVTRQISTDGLSMAGAWVSPLLGLLTLAFLAYWGRGIRFGGATVLLLAVSPIVAHGFHLGRPDHQSLLMLLIAVAFAAETEIWRGKERGRVAAVAWAFALWVSLFEPLILLTAVLFLRVLTRRLRFDRTSFSLFFAIMLVGYLVDGIRPAAFDSHFAGWSRNIGELRHGSLAVFCGWAGWFAVLAPVLLLFRYLQKKEAVCLLLFFLTALLTALTFWYLRWGYFYLIALALSLPSILSLARWRILGWGIFVLSLWPVAAEWERTLYPDDAAFDARVEAVADAVALRDAAVKLKGLPQRGVIAPWWFSPAVVWWSGQPCVAGTSHQSLPGIADVSEFFLSEGDGSDVLKRRKAGYMIAYDPSRVTSNAAQILNRPAPAKPLAERLYNHPHSAGYPLLYANRYFKVFENPADQK